MSSTTITITIIALSLPLMLFILFSMKSKRRKMLRETQIQPEWIEYLTRRIPLYSRLPQELKQQLHGLINVFINEIEFIGCGGQEISDEIRVTVAGQACILLLNRETNYYDELKTIYIYPHTYVQSGSKSRNGSIITEETVACEGEAWQNGPVVLTWDNVVHGASDAKDGHNVVLHEFAHKLDQESGSGNGTPILDHSTQYLAWGRVFSTEFKDLCEKTDKRKKSVMNSYGATNEAEFFAVATETFFEKPKQLYKKHQELYETLKEYYKLDPLQW